MNSLRKEFLKRMVSELQKELELQNQLAVPVLDKVIVNVGLGEAVASPVVLEKVRDDIAVIAGQMPLVTKAKRAISNFKIREGVAVGLSVTLRHDRMWDFFEKLVAIVLPRIRDFRGVSRKCFDGCGNYAIGMGDYTVFPEIDTQKIDKIRGLQVIIVTTADNDKAGMKLLEKLGMPFVKERSIMGAGSK